jgi:hypothetical protein
MEFIRRMKRVPALHPFLFAAFPVLFLYDRNIREYPLDVLWAPLGIVLGIAVAAWIALSAAFRSMRKSGLVVSLFAVLFFAYGHVSPFTPEVAFTFAGVEVKGAALVLAAWAIILAAGAYFTARTRSDLKNLTHVVNAIALVLVLTPSWNIARYRFEMVSEGARHLPAFNEGQAEEPSRAPSPLPNIYHIVLDGYGRSDKLSEVYGFDNSGFLRELEGMGFYVAKSARANYTHTYLSVGSTLNMQYFDSLTEKYGADGEDRDPIYRMARHNRVRDFVKARGYKFVSFSTGYHATEIKDADVYLVAPEQRNEFANGVLNLTPTVSERSKSAQDRRRVLYPLGEMPKLAGSSEPVFVFAHIVAPHSPYVFDSDGGPCPIPRYYGTASGNRLVNRNGLTRGESMRYYVAQAQFIGTAVIKLVRSLLADSKVPPIIIIQGDHGPCPFFNHDNLGDTYIADRMSILAAYYLPSGGQSVLYDSITPVNSFRLIFNYYFGTSLPQLADRSYYVRPDAPYRYIEVTGEIDSPADRQRYERLNGMDYFSDGN